MIYTLTFIIGILLVRLYVVTKANRNILKRYNECYDNYIRLFTDTSKQFVNYSNVLKDLVSAYGQFEKFGKSIGADEVIVKQFTDDKIRIQQILETVYEPQIERSEDFLKKLNELKERVE